MDKGIIKKRVNITIGMIIIWLFAMATYGFFHVLLDIDYKTSIGILLAETAFILCMWCFFFVKAQWLKDMQTGRELYYLNISNILSAIRFAFVPMLIAIFGQIADNGETIKVKLIVLLFAVVICITDLFDGVLARKLNEVTKLGMVLDPVGDFLMITSFAILLFTKGITSWWYFILIMIRIPGLFVLMIIFLITDVKFKLKTSFLGRATIFYLLCSLGVAAVQLFISDPFPYYDIFLRLTEIVGGVLIVASSIQKLKLLRYYLKNQTQLKDELDKENISF